MSQVNIYCDTCSFSTVTSFALTVLALFLVALTGCGDGSSSLSGTITLDGRPLTGGSVSLVPIAEGPTVGCTIQDGRYQVGTLAPGRYRADIMSFAGDEVVVTSSEEMQHRAESRQHSVQMGDIAANAIGNGIEFEVAEGSQKHDFSLTSKNK